MLPRRPHRRVRHAALSALSLLSTLAALGVAAAPLRAQEAPARTLLHVTPYAGYMLSGNLLEGPLGTSISNSNGAVFGAEAGVSLTPQLALVGNVAHASADLQLGIPFLGGVSVGESAMWLYDGALRLSIPLGGGAGRRPFVPFVQGGAGAMRHTVKAGGLQTDATNVAFNAGAGAAIPLSQGLSVHLMVKDYIGRFDFQEATLIDVEGDVAHHWTLSAGLTLGF